MITDKNFNNHHAKPRVLFAPLEWGLGHATRCIPLIREFIACGADVLIAAEGATSALLMNEFPHLKFLPVMGYRIRYSRKKSNLPFILFLQLPKVILTILNEHRWIKKMIREHQVDAVISDNRFGLYVQNIPCIYITHQLLIKTGKAATERWGQKMHYWFIKKYTACWVPDSKENALAGELSHPQLLPPRLIYIGPLSRFGIDAGLPHVYDLLITISGPEPQRTVFENLLFKDLQKYAGKVLFIRGLPGVDTIPVGIPSNIEVRNHLNAEEMNLAMLQSEIIISRCGYTTIMDLVKLKKKAILIPTPGATEQEYLASYLLNRKMFLTCEQDSFSLMETLKIADAFPFDMPAYNMDLYKHTIHEFLAGLMQGR